MKIGFIAIIIAVILAGVLGAYLLTSTDNDASSSDGSNGKQISIRL